MTCQSCVEMERERVENFLQSGKRKKMITHRDKIQHINPLLAFLKTIFKKLKTILKIFEPRLLKLYFFI